MIVIDTDHLSLLQWSGTPPSEPLWQRLKAAGDDAVVTTIVNYEE